MNLLPLLPSGGISTRRLILATLGVGAIVLGLCGWSCAAERQAKAHTAKADTHQTARVVAAAEGAVYDQTAQAQAKDTQAAAAEVARLRRELARLRASLPGPDSTAPAAQPDAAEPVSTTLDLAPLVAKYEELTQAQDREISGLRAEVATLTRARDSWKRAAEEGGREALQLRAALAVRRPSWAAGPMVARDWSGRTYAGAYVRFSCGPVDVQVAQIGDRTALGAGWRW